MSRAKAKADAAPSAFRPVDLRCEYRVDPLGLDERRPRLEWILDPLEASARGLVQKAYRIQVASRLDRLEDDAPDLWDTGRVKSNRTTQIVYEGKPLRSRMRCFWRVRVWDGTGNASDWSRPAHWTMGLLDPGDWTAKWIEEPDPVNFERGRWVWHGECRKACVGAPVSTCALQYALDIPPGATVAKASFLLAADDVYRLFVNGSEIGKGGSSKDKNPVPGLFDLTEVLAPGGVNLLTVFATNETEGAPAGATGKLVVRFADQRQLSIPMNETWKAAPVEHDEDAKPKRKKGKSARVGPNGETLALLAAAFHPDWPAAVCMGGVGEDNVYGPESAKWPVPGSDDPLILPPVPRFRKEFTLESVPARADIHVAAAGLFALRINGRKVGNDRLTPGWPDYLKRVYSKTYEVADLLVAGANAIAIELADGWGAGYVAWGRLRNRFGLEAALRAQLTLDFDDERTETVVTDETWTCSLDGPTREADLLMGTTYDARREQPGWDRAGFDAADWTPVARTALPEGLTVEPNPTDSVRLHEELVPVHIAEPRPGVYVFDLAQNMVGIVRLRVTGPRGTVVRLRHAEVLEEDGMLYTVALRGARATDTYIKGTDDIEIWEPNFTFHGFRYVELTGLAEAPTHETVTGLVLHNAMTPAGDFSSSNIQVNRLFRNIVWGQKGNFLEAPTDCPQRDERLGWTGDAQIFIRTGTFNFDIASFMSKYVRDLFDAQSEEGWFHVVAPNLPFDPLPKHCAHAWSDAAIICPWTLHRVYGDTRVLERYYDRMVFYIEHLKDTSDGLIRPPGGYGDWVALNAHTPTELSNTAYFALVVRMMADIAEALGKKKDAKAYAALFEDIRAAFQKTFLEHGGRLRGNTQTDYVLALQFDLLPEDLRPVAMAHLVQDFAYRGYHFSTGFVGIKDIMPALSEGGRDDLAYRLLLQDTFPSWGYEIQCGATTIWERWDGWSEELGLQDPGMNSFNHYAFGAVGEWMFRYAAGIDLLDPCYRRIRIRPRPGGNLRDIRARFRSPLGWIDCEWYRGKSEFRLVVRIPANAKAEIHVPCPGGDATRVQESGKSASKARGLRFLRSENEAAVFEAGSGHYIFTAPVA